MGRVCVCVFSRPRFHGKRAVGKHGLLFEYAPEWTSGDSLGYALRFRGGGGGGGWWFRMSPGLPFFMTTLGYSGGMRTYLVSVFLFA